MSTEASSAAWRFLVLIVLLALAMAGVAMAAEDGKVYPGIMCQRALGLADDVVYSGDGGVYNKNRSGSIVVVCPIVRDVVLGTLGANSAEVRVRQGGSIPVSCTLYSRGPFGIPYYQGQSVETTPAGANPPSFFTLKFGKIAAYTEGYYHFQCIIPPIEKEQESGVLSYRLDESDVPP